MPTLQQLAAERLLQRRRARSTMAEWSRLNGYEPAKHHRFLIEHLEAVVRGEIKRLAIFLPPGSAKSTYASVLFPPWYLAQREKSSILVASHSDNLAESFGRRARNLVALHPQILGYALRSDSKAAGEWNTTNGGLYFCAGVGTKVAGHRFHLGLIDDPVGKKEDAESKLIRDKCWDWYNFDFLPRQEPDAAVVLIQTRWHDDDFAGRILANEKGWKVVDIPFDPLANDPLGRKEGDLSDYLWKDYLTQEQAISFRSSPAYQAMYQQRPVPDSGDYFKKEWIVDSAYKDEAALPRCLRWYVGSDHAFSQKEEADRNAIVPAGVDENGDLWIPPQVWWPRDRRPMTDEIVDQMFRINRMFKPIYWWAGKDHIVSSIGPFIDRMQRELREYIPLEPLSESRDKQTKCQPIRSMFKLGRVHLPAFADWYPDALSELLRFDKGLHDDFVDGLEKLGRGLDAQIGARSPTMVSEPLEPPTLTLDWVRNSHDRLAREEDLAGVGM